MLDKYNGLTLDEAAQEAGGYLAPPSKRNMDADYHAMSLYCRKKGIKPMDLTDEEYESFLFKSK